MQLIIGNKNYSSWSMRPWVLMTQLGIAFEERQLRFDFTPGSSFYQALAAYTPTAKVPVLVEDDGFAVWDTLAIIEHLSDRHPDRGVWPHEPRQRSRARSLCAEMHAGFSALRNQCPMNIEASLPGIGAKLMADDARLRADLARIDGIFSAAAPDAFLFGPFCAADAFFAPVVMRIATYALQLSPAATAYAQRVRESAGVKAFVAQALDERDFLDFEEPYRTAP